MFISGTMRGVTKNKYDVKRVLKLQVNILIDFDPSKTEIIYNCKIHLCRKYLIENKIFLSFLSE